MEFKTYTCTDGIYYQYDADADKRISELKFQILNSAALDFISSNKSIIHDRNNTALVYDTFKLLGEMDKPDWLLVNITKLPMTYKAGWHTGGQDLVTKLIDDHPDDIIIMELGIGGNLSGLPNPDIRAEEMFDRLTEVFDFADIDKYCQYNYSFYRPCMYLNSRGREVLQFIDNNY